MFFFFCCKLGFVFDCKRLRCCFPGVEDLIYACFLCVCVCVCVCVFVCLLCCCFMRHSKRYFSSLPCFTISSMRALRSSLLCISLAVTHCALLLLLFFPLPVCFRLHRSSLFVFFSPITRVFLNYVASIVSQSFFLSLIASFSMSCTTSMYLQ